MIVSLEQTSWLLSTDMKSDVLSSPIDGDMELWKLSRNLKSLFNKKFISNFDHGGFNYEPANMRILSLKGERDTWLLLNRMNKQTHSYTLQPMTTRDVL